MSDSVRPPRRLPTRLCHSWDSPGKNTGVGCHFLLQCMEVKSESEVAQSYLTLSDPMDCSLTGSSVHGIFQAKILKGVSFPSPRDVPDPGIKPRSPALQADALLSELPGELGYTRLTITCSFSLDCFNHQNGKISHSGKRLCMHSCQVASVASDSLQLYRL